MNAVGQHPAAATEVRDKPGKRPRLWFRSGPLTEPRGRAPKMWRRTSWRPMKMQTASSTWRTSPRAVRFGWSCPVYSCFRGGTHAVRVRWSIGCWHPSLSRQYGCMWQRSIPPATCCQVLMQRHQIIGRYERHQILPDLCCCYFTSWRLQTFICFDHIWDGWFTG